MSENSDVSLSLTCHVVPLAGPSHVDVVKVSANPDDTVDVVRHKILDNGAYPKNDGDIPRRLAFLSGDLLLASNKETQTKVSHLLPKLFHGKPKHANFLFKDVEYRKVRVVYDDVQGVVCCACILRLTELGSEDQPGQELQHYTQPGFGFIFAFPGVYPAHKYWSTLISLCMAAATGKGNMLSKLLSTIPSNTDIQQLKDECGATPLHHSAQAGLLQCSIAIVTHFGPQIVDAQDLRGRTPLHCAILRNNIEVTAALLALKPSLDVMDNNEETVLSLLAKWTNDQLFTLVGLIKIESCDLEVQHKLFHLLYQRNLSDRQIESLHTLLQNNHTIDALDSIGVSLLQYAVTYGHVRIVKALIQYGASLERRSQNGHIPLSVACQAGHAELIPLLIPSHLEEADILKSLKLAIVWNKVQAAIRLLESKPELVLDDEARALVVVALDKNFPKNRLLLKYCNDSVLCTRFLPVASRAGQENMAKVLIKHGALYNSQDLMGRTSLHEAAQRGSLQIISYLLQRKKLDPNICDWRGQTALHYACAAGQIDTASKLLEDNRTLANIRDCAGMTPLSLAFYRGKFKAADFLVNKLKEKINYLHDDLDSLVYGCTGSLPEATWPLLLDLEYKEDAGRYQDPEKPTRQSMPAETVWSLNNSSDYVQTSLKRHRSSKTLSEQSMSEPGCYFLTTDLGQAFYQWVRAKRHLQGDDVEVTPEVDQTEHQSQPTRKRQCRLSKKMYRKCPMCGHMTDRFSSEKYKSSDLSCFQPFEFHQYKTFTTSEPILHSLVTQNHVEALKAFLAKRVRHNTTSAIDQAARSFRLQCLEVLMSSEKEPNRNRVRKLLEICANTEAWGEKEKQQKVKVINFLMNTWKQSKKEGEFVSETKGDTPPELCHRCNTSHKQSASPSVDYSCHWVVNCAEFLIAMNESSKATKTIRMLRSSEKEAALTEMVVTGKNAELKLSLDVVANSSKANDQSKKKMDVTAVSSRLMMAACSTQLKSLQVISVLLDSFQDLLERPVYHKNKEPGRVYLVELLKTAKTTAGFKWKAESESIICYLVKKGYQIGEAKCWNGNETNIVNIGCEIFRAALESKSWSVLDCLLQRGVGKELWLEIFQTEGVTLTQLVDSDDIGSEKKIQTIINGLMNTSCPAHLLSDFIQSGIKLQRDGLLKTLVCQYTSKDGKNCSVSGLPVYVSLVMSQETGYDWERIDIRHLKVLGLLAASEDTLQPIVIKAQRNWLNNVVNVNLLNRQNIDDRQLHLETTPLLYYVQRAATEQTSVLNAICKDGDETLLDTVMKISCQIELDRKDICGRSALATAACWFQKGTVSKLIAAGAQVTFDDLLACVGHLPDITDKLVEPDKRHNTESAKQQLTNVQKNDAMKQLTGTQLSKSARSKPFNPQQHKRLCSDKMEAMEDIFHILMTSLHHIPDKETDIATLIKAVCRTGSRKVLETALEKVPRAKDVLLGPDTLGSAIVAAVECKNGDLLCFVWSLSPKDMKIDKELLEKVLLSASSSGLWKEMEYISKDLAKRECLFVNSTDEHGRTILHLAARENKAEIIKTICRHAKHLKTDQLDMSKHSALWYAMANHHFECCYLLLLHGADPRLAPMWLLTSLNKKRVPQYPKTELYQYQEVINDKRFTSETKSQFFYRGAKRGVIEKRNSQKEVKHSIECVYPQGDSINKKARRKEILNPRGTHNEVYSQGTPQDVLSESETYVSQTSLHIWGKIPSEDGNQLSETHSSFTSKGFPRKRQNKNGDKKVPKRGDSQPKNTINLGVASLGICPVGNARNVITCRQCSAGFDGGWIMQTRSSKIAGSTADDQTQSTISETRDKFSKEGFPIHTNLSPRQRKLNGKFIHPLFPNSPLVTDNTKSKSVSTDKTTSSKPAEKQVNSSMDTGQKAFPDGGEQSREDPKKKREQLPSSIYLWGRLKEEPEDHLTNYQKSYGVELYPPFTSKAKAVINALHPKLPLPQMKDSSGNTEEQGQTRLKLPIVPYGNSNDVRFIWKSNSKDFNVPIFRQNSIPIFSTWDCGGKHMSETNDSFCVDNWTKYTKLEKHVPGFWQDDVKTGPPGTNAITTMEAEGLTISGNIMREFAKLVRYYKAAIFGVSRNGNILHGACANGFTEVVETVVKKRPSTLNQTDAKNRTPAFYAAANGQVEILKLLSEKKTDYKKGTSPLIGAVIHALITTKNKIYKLDVAAKGETIKIPSLSLKTESKCGDSTCLEREKVATMLMQNRPEIDKVGLKPRKLNVNMNAQCYAKKRCLKEIIESAANFILTQHADVISFEAKVRDCRKIAARCLQLILTAVDNDPSLSADDSNSVGLLLLYSKSCALLEPMTPLLPSQLLIKGQTLQFLYGMLVCGDTVHPGPETDRHESIAMAIARKSPQEARSNLLILDAQILGFTSVTKLLLSSLSPDKSEGQLQYFVSSLLTDIRLGSMLIESYLGAMQVFDQNQNLFFIKQVALHVSIIEGQYAAVEIVLKEGADLFHRVNAEMMDWVISMNTPKVGIHLGWTPLHTACKCGDSTIVQLLLDQVRVIPGDSSLSELALELPYICAAYGNENSYIMITEQLDCPIAPLSDSGAFTGLSNRIDARSVLLAAAKNGHEELSLRVFYQQGGAVMCPCSDNENNIFHYAGQTGLSNLVRLLLANDQIGFQFDDEHGLTPCDYAQLFGNIEIVQSLGSALLNLDLEPPPPPEKIFGIVTYLERWSTGSIDFGTHVLNPKRRKNGKRLFKFLRFEAKFQNIIAEMLCSGGDHQAWGMLQAYRYQGPHLFVPNLGGQSLLHIAARGGCVRSIELMIEILIQSDPSVTEIIRTSDKAGNTPLSIAVLYGNTRCASLLLPYENDVNWSSKKTGETILHLAIRIGNAAMLNTIMSSCGHDLIEKTDKEGNSCIHYVTLHNRRSLVEDSVSELLPYLPAKSIVMESQSWPTKTRKKRQKAKRKNSAKEDTGQEISVNSTMKYNESTLLNYPSKEQLEKWKQTGSANLTTSDPDLGITLALHRVEDEINSWFGEKLKLEVDLASFGSLGTSLGLITMGVLPILRGQFMKYAEYLISVRELMGESVTNELGKLLKWEKLPGSKLTVRFSPNEQSVTALVKPELFVCCLKRGKIIHTPLALPGLKDIYIRYVYGVWLYNESAKLTIMNESSDSIPPQNYLEYKKLPEGNKVHFNLDIDIDVNRKQHGQQAWMNLVTGPVLNTLRHIVATYRRKIHLLSPFQGLKIICADTPSVAVRNGCLLVSLKILNEEKILAPDFDVFFDNLQLKEIRASTGLTKAYDILIHDFQKSVHEGNIVAGSNFQTILTHNVADFLATVCASSLSSPEQLVNHHLARILPEIVIERLKSFVCSLMQANRFSFWRETKDVSRKELKSRNLQLLLCSPYLFPRREMYNNDGYLSCSSSEGRKDNENKHVKGFQLCTVSKNSAVDEKCKESAILWHEKIYRTTIKQDIHELTQIMSSSIKLVSPHEKANLLEKEKTHNIYLKDLFSWVCQEVIPLKQNAKTRGMELVMPWLVNTSFQLSSEQSHVTLDSQGVKLLGISILWETFPADTERGIIETLDRFRAAYFSLLNGTINIHCDETSENLSHENPKYRSSSTRTFEIFRQAFDNIVIKYEGAENKCKDNSVLVAASGPWMMQMEHVSKCLTIIVTEIIPDGLELPLYSMCPMAQCVKQLSRDLVLKDLSMSFSKSVLKPFTREISLLLDVKLLENDITFSCDQEQDSRPKIISKCSFQIQNYLMQKEKDLFERLAFALKVMTSRSQSLKKRYKTLKYLQFRCVHKTSATLSGLQFKDHTLVFTWPFDHTSSPSTQKLPNEAVLVESLCLTVASKVRFSNDFLGQVFPAQCRIPPEYRTSVQMPTLGKTYKFKIQLNNVQGKALMTTPNTLSANDVTIEIACLSRHKKTSLVKSLKTTINPNGFVEIVWTVTTKHDGKERSKEDPVPCSISLKIYGRNIFGAPFSSLLLPGDDKHQHSISKGRLFGLAKATTEAGQSIYMLLLHEEKVFTSMKEMLMVISKTEKEKYKTMSPRIHFLRGETDGERCKNESEMGTLNEKDSRTLEHTYRSGGTIFLYRYTYKGKRKSGDNRKLRMEVMTGSTCLDRGLVRCMMYAAGEYNIRAKCSKCRETLDIVSSMECKEKSEVAVVVLPGEVSAKNSTYLSTNPTEKTGTISAGKTQRFNLQMFDDFGNAIPLSLVETPEISIVCQEAAAPEFLRCNAEAANRDDGILLITSDNLTKEGGYVVCINQTQIGTRSTLSFGPGQATCRINTFLLRECVPNFHVEPGPVVGSYCAINESNKKGVIKIGFRRRVNFTIQLRDMYKNVAKVTKHHVSKTIVEFDDITLSAETKASPIVNAVECWLHLKTYGVYKFKVRYEGKYLTIGDSDEMVFSLTVDQREPLSERLDQFRNTIRNARNEYGSHFGILISRRERVFEDSYHHFLSEDNLEKKLTQNMYIRFNNEWGIDAGGVRREWYQLLSREAFNPDFALFSEAEDGTQKPNSNSDINPEHLSMFKFVGQVFGKAVFDGDTLDVHLASSVYKHLLGIPPSLDDVMEEDKNLYKSLKSVRDITDADDMEACCFTFTVTQSRFGENTEVPLKENGQNIEVTLGNRNEYLALYSKYILQDSVKAQLEAFKEGFNTLIKPSYINNFDPIELEHIVSGEQTVDVELLKNRTEYVGYRSQSDQINWLWKSITSFDQEERASFLQFITGSRRVPVHASHSRTWKLCIDANSDISLLPTASTCFNQLHLPRYKTEEDLHQKLKTAISFGAEGLLLS